jgi:hypothetical protein
MPVAKLDNAPRCQHTKLNGEPCRCPAIRGQQFCHFHHAVEATNYDFSLPFVEDAASLQIALMQVIRALGTRAMDYKSASLTLYALQIACSNLKRLMAEQQPSQDDAKYAEEQSLARLLINTIREENPAAAAALMAQHAAEMAAAAQPGGAE